MSPSFCANHPHLRSYRILNDIIEAVCFSHLLPFPPKLHQDSLVDKKFYGG